MGFPWAQWPALLNRGPEGPNLQLRWEEHGMQVDGQLLLFMPITTVCSLTFPFVILCVQAIHLNTSLRSVAKYA